jgi:hypothetical protein
MIIHQVEQRSEEWFAIRAGKITASVASKLVTPTGKRSVQYRGEIARVIAEARGLQEPELLKPTYWMERGVDMEDEARAWFEVETGLATEVVGFIESDDHLSGFSPDCITAQGTIAVELKCPKPSTHIQWLMDGILPKEHLGQCHFGMAITGARYTYFMSYCPEIEPLIIKLERDDYTQTMVDAIANYIDEFKSAYEKVTGESYEAM